MNGYNTFNAYLRAILAREGRTRILHGRVLKTVTVDVSNQPVNLLSRRRGGEFTIESREPSAFPRPDNLHHTSSFLDLLMRNLVTMSQQGEREREEGGKKPRIDALVIAILSLPPPPFPRGVPVVERDHFSPPLSPSSSFRERQDRRMLKVERSFDYASTTDGADIFGHIR